MAVNSAAIHDRRPLRPGVATASDAPWARWTQAGATAFLVLDATWQVRLPVSPGALDVASVRLVDGTPVTAKEDGPELVVEVPTPDVAGPVVVGFALRA
jgi:alpha-L-fucosidase